MSGVEVPVPFGHYFMDDPKVYTLPGSGFKVGAEPPPDCLHVAPLYSQATVDTLRAQLEAAELRDAQMRDAAKLLLARAEAAEAECARLRADAERYEFIRSASTPKVPELNVLAMGALDRAIDAAIARTKEQQA